MSANSPLPRIAVTMGDPAGVGPELIVKALSRTELLRKCTPLVLGDEGVLHKARRESGGSVEFNVIQSPAESLPGRVNMMSLSKINLMDFNFGQPRADHGLISTFYIVKAAEMVSSGEVDALVTGPINKAILLKAGYDYTGHTEMLKAATGSEYAASMLVGERLRFTRVTGHCALREVADLITEERVSHNIHATHKALTIDFDIAEPRIGVCSLDPHCGRDGLFGSADDEMISPACDKARREGIMVDGPLASEVIFPRAGKGEFDAVVCMYHDQLLIPFELINTGPRVNFTVGLPIVRTSPGHDPGYDIAGKGLASEKGMLWAIELAFKAVANRRRKAEPGA